MPRCQSSTYLRRIAVPRHPNAPGPALTQGTNPQADPTPGGFALALGASIAASLPPLMKRLSLDEAVPHRGEPCQDAKRAPADIEGHSEAAKFSEPGRLGTSADPG